MQARSLEVGYNDQRKIPLGMSVNTPIIGISFFYEIIIDNLVFVGYAFFCSLSGKYKYIRLRDKPPCRVATTRGLFFASIQYQLRLIQRSKWYSPHNGVEQVRMATGPESNPVIYKSLWVVSSLFARPSLNSKGIMASLEWGCQALYTAYTE